MMTTVTETDQEAPPETKSETKTVKKRAPTRTQYGKRIVTSLGDKGGTSKTFLVRKIAEVHLAANTAKLSRRRRQHGRGTLQILRRA